MPTTFIKLDRSITKWRWFQDRNTLQLWLYILINANITDYGFEDITVHRGELVTSYDSLSKSTGQTVKELRTALGHLIKTGEVAIRKYPKFSVISVINYNLYQGSGQATGNQWAVQGQATDNQWAVQGQAEGKQRAEEGQQYNNERMKECNNEIMEEACAQSPHAHGRLGNVFLTEKEYKQFLSDYPLIAEKVIDELSVKIATGDGRYRKGHIGHLYIFARNYTEEKSETEKKPSFDIELAMKRSLMIDPTKTKRNQ